MSEAILLVGGTGLIGRSFVQQMIEHGPSKNLHILGRRPVDCDHGDAQIHVAPNEDWREIIASIKPAMAVSCLGSTIKKAGSQEAFAAIDRDLAGAVAAASKQAGTKHFIAISSTLANSRASNFYLKTKGQTEDLMRDAGFDRLDLIRPGLLRGKRIDDHRLGESLAIIASPIIDNLLHGSLRKYRSIEADIVAAAIRALLVEEQTGEHIHENDAIRALGKSI